MIWQTNTRKLTAVERVVNMVKRARHKETYLGVCLYRSRFTYTEAEAVRRALTALMRHEHQVTVPGGGEEREQWWFVTPGAMEFTDRMGVRQQFPNLRVRETLLSPSDEGWGHYHWIALGSKVRARRSRFHQNVSYQGSGQGQRYEA